MPGIPTNLAANSTGRTTARLTWKDDQANTAVEVYRSATNDLAAARCVAVIPQGEQIYLQQALRPGTTYYFWVRGRSDGDSPSDPAGPVSSTTLGNLGNPGDYIIREIVQAAEARAADVLPSDWRQLEYARDLAKNSKMGSDRGWGVRWSSQQPASAPVFGSYRQQLALQVVLMMGVPTKGDQDLAEAEQEAASWADRFIRDFLTTRMYMPQYVIQVKDPSQDAPLYLQDAEALALVITFPTIYSNRLKP